MAELAVETPNLLRFPMGKLCYDLVLEVIDELEPKDVLELMKVDRRFRWILLQKPGRIFGKQIHLISVEMGDRSLDDERKRYEDLVFIMKFAESRPLPFHFVSHKVLLLSQVERCLVLNISDMESDVLDEEELSALKKAFANLKQVNELEVDICGDDLNDFLWNLKVEVTDQASLRFSDLQGETHQRLMLSLINGSLQNCKMISVRLSDVPDFYPTVYSALSKTQLELFVTGFFFENVKSAIELILNSGIPSENKEAACFVRGHMGVEIKNLIKHFPEIRQINEPNKTFIEDTMMKTLRKHGFTFQCCDRSYSDDSLSVYAESLSVSEDARSDFDHSRSDSGHSRSDSDRSHSHSDHSRSDSDHSRSRSVSDNSRSDSDHSRSDFDHALSDFDHARSDFDHSLHSMDFSPIKRRFEHDVYLYGPFDCYLKRIDKNRDCIYVVRHGFFFAKYVSSIQF